jgi:uncharacterized repeat protein (TIGR01451 family)
VTHGNGTGGTISDGRGGAIGFSSATLTLTDSVVSNSTATTEGGGIYDAGTMTIQNSTITGNSVTGLEGNGGGGIAVEDMLTMANSTVTGNTAGSNGGGIYNDDTALITNTTITGNTAANFGGGIYSESTTATNVTLASNNSPDGANVFVDDTTSGGFQNTIVSSPEGGGGNCDTSGSFPASMGHNLEDDAGHSCQFTDPTDQSGVDPKLASLASNGGPTQTMELLAGSPAIDTGATLAAVTTDQRGGPRPQGGGYDIGAYERSAILDVGISDPPSPNPVTAGGALTYTLTVTNNGPLPEPAFAVTVVDTLPSSVTLKSATPSQGSCTSSSGTVTCSLGTIAQGASATVTIVVTPNSPGAISNTATVSTSALDPNSANNSVTDSVQVLAAPVQVTKSGAKPAAVTGNATGVGFTFATLHGKVNPNGSATTYSFQYGRTNHYGSHTSSSSAGSGNAFRSVARKVSGLHPGTLYHYRIVAKSAQGTVNGTDRTLRTPRRPSLHVNPSRVRAGAQVRVFGNADGCPRGDQVTLLSRAFSHTHDFAGVPAIFATVKSRGAFSTFTRIPVGRAAGRYVISARCGGGNLGVTTHLTVFTPVSRGFTG